MSWIALLAAIAKAIPALAGVCNRLMELLEREGKRKNEREALERLEAKNESVDERIDGLLGRRIDPVERVYGSAAEQRGEVDGASGLPGGGKGRTGVVPGRAQND